MLEKIVENETTSEQINSIEFAVLIKFDKAFLMALTSKEQLFIERLLYRRFLHNDLLPYFQ